MNGFVVERFELAPNGLECRKKHAFTSAMTAIESFPTPLPHRTWFDFAQGNKALHPCSHLGYDLCAAHGEQAALVHFCQGNDLTKRPEVDRAEPKAKAALLDFLRSMGRLSSQSSVTAELILDNYRVRVDIALCDRKDLHCYEIKTERDTLARLDRQLEVYARHADFVTVVAATRHISTIISRVNPHVGIYEMVGFDSPHPLRLVREATRSPTFDADALLSLLPVKDLQSRLAITGRRRRCEVVSEAAVLDVDKKKQAVLAFFAERYGPNSRTFWRATRRRKIRPEDLSILRRWDQQAKTIDQENFILISPPARRSCPDAEVYRHVGRSFGPVPDELRALLVG